MAVLHLVSSCPDGHQDHRVLELRDSSACEQAVTSTMMVAGLCVVNPERIDNLRSIVSPNIPDSITVATRKKEKTRRFQVRRRKCAHWAARKFATG